ncbi:MAG: hypothetical protein A2X48_13080 [Lentisphaerae bacterium GWF2_49_21]|nr:MAG: hypothetical protein A2X48_13080 [Lentisphaerae bacterium GWF2_49_21]
MSKNNFNFLLVGTGNIARTYAGAVNNLPHISVVGVVSRSAERAECFIKDNRLNNASPAESISTFTEDFDAVILATPNGMHHQPAIEAAKMGKHVFTEKVLDIDREKITAMLDECQKHQVKLGVAFQRRLSPDNITLKNMIDKGKLGKIFAVDLRVKLYRGQDYYDSAAYRGSKNIDGGGCFIQQAIHNIDILCHFFGLPEKTISAYGTFTHQMEAEDHGAALLVYPDGKIASIVASTACKPGFLNRMEIHSDKGSIILENDQIVHWTIDGSVNPAQKVKNIHTGGSMAVEDTSAHEQLLEDFVSAVKDDREPLVSGKSASMATELIFRIYEGKIN